MKRKIIVVTGLPGSGKSEVSREIEKKGIPTFVTGNMIREEVSRRGLDLTLESSEYVARELRKHYGPDAPIKMMEHKIRALDDRLVCVDGPRNLKELEYLKRLGEVHLIIVESSRRVRYTRLRKRAKPQDPEGWENFLWRDRKELERGMESLVRTEKFTKYRIRNTGTLPILRKKVASIIAKIRSSPPKKPAK
jgi:dephospho-CoA kinase